MSVRKQIATWKCATCAKELEIFDFTFLDSWVGSKGKCDCGTLFTVTLHDLSPTAQLRINYRRTEQLAEEVVLTFENQPSALVRVVCFYALYDMGDFRELIHGARLIGKIPRDVKVFQMYNLRESDWDYWKKHILDFLKTQNINSQKVIVITPDYRKDFLNEVIRLDNIRDKILAFNYDRR